MTFEEFDLLADVCDESDRSSPIYAILILSSAQVKRRATAGVEVCDL
mgnify:CR=1 FL=1